MMDCRSERLFEGQNAMITGASGGLGRALVEEFARHGANIFACSRKTEQEYADWLAGISEKYKVNITSSQLLLGTEENMEEELKSILKSAGHLEILINNAGITKVALLHETSMQTLKHVFDINYFSQILICQKVSRLMMRHKNGSIINITSSQADNPQIGRLAYASSKAALANATKLMARELAPFGIRVNAIAPGAVQTPLLDKYPPKGLEEYINGSLQKRVGKPEEIARLASFLSSSDASYITGQLIHVDGGRL